MGEIVEGSWNIYYRDWWLGAVGLCLKVLVEEKRDQDKPDCVCKERPVGATLTKEIPLKLAKMEKEFK